MKSKKTKILYLITLSEFGGAQKNVLDLTTGLAGDKYEILVAAGLDGGGGFFKELAKNQINYRQLRWLRRRATNPLIDLLGLWEIIRLIKKGRPDILHLHSSKAGFSGTLAAKIYNILHSPSPKLKVVYTVHGAVFEAAFSYPARKFYLWLEKFGAYFKDKIICVSENDKKLWLKYRAAPEEKLVVIHNGLDLNNLEFLPKDEAREKLLNLPQPPFIKGEQGGIFTKGGLGPPDGEVGRIFIGTIANLYPEKGLPFLIQAADIIINQNQIKNIIFAVIGEGMERKLLEEMIEKRRLKNNFILPGNIPEAAQYLKAFNIFVLPSVKEGLPYTILEAMAAGLPIVASYVGGIPEMVENEKNGFLVLPRNPEMLAARIIELFKNPELAERFAQMSKIKIRDFSLKKMVKETEQAYEDL